ncbi:MAG: ABC transporter permease [Acholeplasmatales bacterium]|jgi:ABC-type dipeptide/oligopeptide/nickel transport system permease subunit|nr:ABC transporter permease [Acholeplasmatales bacterium]
MTNTEKRQYTAEDFEIVGSNEKIFDQKFEGKPRSFLHDAMLRFLKNKVNLVATTIVFVMVLLSVFVPALTTKDFNTGNNAKLKYLPPRVPFFDNFGFLDGSVRVNGFPADRSLINEDGLYLPKYDLLTKYVPEYIKKGSLTNDLVYGSTRSPDFIGGENIITLLGRTNEHLVSDLNPLDFDAGTVITITVNEIEKNSSLELLLKPLNFANPDVSPDTPEILEQYTHLIETTQKGVFSVTLDSALSGTLALHYLSSENRASVTLHSIEIDYKNVLTPDDVIDGYRFACWEGVNITDFGGNWTRYNAELIVCSFVYYPYEAIFADFDQLIPKSEYDAYVAENPELEKTVEEGGAIEYYDPSDPSKGWYIHGEKDYYYKEVVWISKPITGPGGIKSYTYRVIIDGVLDSGYTEIPYFIFGTDSAGRDLFAEIWLSLRTSLLLGVIISVINIIIGVCWGSISGYYGGLIDFAMERFCEFLSSFPGLTILTILYLKYGPGLILILVYLTYSGWIGVAGTTRIQFYRYRGREYVLASKTLGAKDRRLIFKHILPNGIGLIITRSVLSIPSMIFVEANLSFLGFGIGHGVELNFGLFKLSGLSLGVVLYDGQTDMLSPGRIYLLIIPSIVIIILMIVFNLFGNALRDAMNPSLRGQE